MTQQANTKSSVDVLVDYFRIQIQSGRSHVPILVQRVQQRFLEEGRTIKRKNRGLTTEQEEYFLQSLERFCYQGLSLMTEVVLYVDYEPQGLFTRFLNEFGIDAKSFCYKVMLPPKLHISLTENSLLIADNGKTILEWNCSKHNIP